VSEERGLQDGNGSGEMATGEASGADGRVATGREGHGSQDNNGLGKERMDGDEVLAGAGGDCHHEEEELYEVGEWKGMRQWRCRLCPWDTLDGEGAMLAHLAAQHFPPEERRRSGILVADKYGRVKSYKEVGRWHDRVTRRRC